MSWIKVEDKFALEATPDPAKLLTLEQMQQEVTQKQQEVTMYESEIEHLTIRKSALETEIAEIQALLEE